jgi:hypothetical protein
MSAPRDPDTILTAWLEDGPNELPDTTRRAIGAGVRMTAQARRRFGWLERWTRVPRFERLGAVTAFAVVTIVAIVALSAIRAPSDGIGGLPTPSPSASQPFSSPSPSAFPSSAPTPPWHPFTSERFGYTVEVPGSWTSTNLSGLDWMPDDLYPGPDADYADRWQEPGTTSPWLLVAVRDPAPDESVDAWVARYGSGMVAQCDATETPVSVDQEPGVLRIGACDPLGLAMMDVLVVHDSRAYAIQLNYPSADDVANRALLDQILASLQFTP